MKNRPNWILSYFSGDDSGNVSIEKDSKEECSPVKDSKDDSKEESSPVLDPVEKIRLFLEQKLGISSFEVVDNESVQVKEITKC